MSLFHPQELMTRAYAAGYAVPPLLARSAEEAGLFLQAVAAGGSPAVLRLDMAEGGGDLAPEILRLASDAEVPLVLQGECKTQTAFIRVAAESGCSAVSVDGSALGLEDNIALSAEAAKQASVFGLWSQGCLSICGPAGEGPQPGDAGRFVSQSGCQGLRVQQQGAAEPSFDMLVQLSSVLQLFPLVIRPSLDTLLEAASEPAEGFGPPLDPRLLQVCRLGVCAVEVDELPPRREGYGELLAGAMARGLKSAGQAEQPVF